MPFLCFVKTKVSVRKPLNSHMNVAHAVGVVLCFMMAQVIDARRLAQRGQCYSAEAAQAVSPPAESPLLPPVRKEGTVGAWLRRSFESALEDLDLTPCMLGELDRLSRIARGLVPHPR